VLLIDFLSFAGFLSAIGIILYLIYILDTGHDGGTVVMFFMFNVFYTLNQGT